MKQKISRAEYEARLREYKKKHPNPGTSMMSAWYWSAKRTKAFQEELRAQGIVVEE